MKKTIHIFLFGAFMLFFNACSEQDPIDDSGKGSITGKVVLEGSNTPVENAKVSTNPATSEVFTNEDGDFLIIDVPIGDYSIQAQKKGLATAFEGTSVQADSQVSVIFEMKPESVLNLAPIAPELISPEEGADDLGLEVEFVWTSSKNDEDTINYTLELRNNATDEIQMFEGITDTTYTVNGLLNNRKYFWQVSASDGISSPVRSKLSSFSTQPVDDSRIVFTRVINGNNVIFSVTEDGVEFQLTSSDKNSFRPRKNDAVNKIAFLRTVAGQTHLFTMNPDGSDELQITTSVPVNGFNFEVVDFSWADNGSSLVYPHFSQLYKVNISGGGTTMLYQTPNGKFITECDVNSTDDKIALVVNNTMGYDAEIIVIDAQGNLLETVVTGFSGALGGINFSVDSQKLLYTRDLSGFENSSYRQLDMDIFLYDFNSQITINISQDKTTGTNDFDPRFSPNEAEVIFVNTDNDGISENSIYKTRVDNPNNTRVLINENAKMPDWE